MLRRPRIVELLAATFRTVVELTPQPAPVIMPFSDGMDSRMVATLPREEPLVLVRLGDKQIDCPEVDGLKRAFTTVPYGVPGRCFAENSGRARGFKFAMLGALAAYLSQGRRIVVPESGQGALGPVLVGHHDGDYRSHPVFLRKIERLVAARAERGELAPERDRVAAQVEGGAGIGPLVGDVDGARVAERQPGSHARLGEAGARPALPLHRRAAGVAAARIERDRQQEAAAADAEPAAPEPSDDPAQADQEEPTQT